MAHELLNTLYVMSPGAVAHLEGEAVAVYREGERLARVPLHHLGSIVIFGAAAPSHPLIERCATDGREMCLMDMGGRLRARVVGPTGGNVLLRKAQYDAQSDAARTLAIARPIVAGKVRNQRSTLLRAAREARDAAAAERLRAAAAALAGHVAALPAAPTLGAVRGIEGQAASAYFGVFGDMITRPPSEFAFRTRTRRPPRDRVNALLSFLYAMLTNDCVGAANGVGLDPQFGYLHALRPGKPSLALDLMEEFRSVIADRLVLALINRKQIQPAHFEDTPEPCVLLTEEGRKIVLAAYQQRKQEEVLHPFLKQQTPIGLVPHLQARLLARHLRGDLAEYPPYLAR